MNKNTDSLLKVCKQKHCKTKKHDKRILQHPIQHRSRIKVKISIFSFLVIQAIKYMKNSIINITFTNSVKKAVFPQIFAKSCFLVINSERNQSRIFITQIKVARHFFITIFNTSFFLQI